MFVVGDSLFPLATPHLMITVSSQAHILRCANQTVPFIRQQSFPVSHVPHARLRIFQSLLSVGGLWFVAFTHVRVWRAANRASSNPTQSFPGLIRISRLGFRVPLASQQASPVGPHHNQPHRANNKATGDSELSLDSSTQTEANHFALPVHPFIIPSPSPQS